MTDSKPEESLSDLTQEFVGDKDNSLIGSEIGPYRLLQVIGEGGMGTVYFAEQTKPVRRRVALKIIKLGMDSNQILARFEAERQALYLMDHPNIARALDAGTTTAGQPYFVMEAIKGLSLTDYCRQKRLSLEDRLKLLIPICSAVQHAHQKGIIHRDLKPTNILVTEHDGRPVPKVIDFGLAKALHQPLTERTVYTQVGQVVGTLEYLSPEQSSINQLDIDSRTDIYSLGVLLYELLTGTLPFDKNRLRSGTLERALSIIREEEPFLPSQKIGQSQSSEKPVDKSQGDRPRQRSAVRGELDWIVIKAMAKERNERYGSAYELGAELERYLAGEAVVAAPPSAGYRIRKFVGRHRAAVVTTVLVATALIMGLIGTSWGLAKALRAKKDASESAKSALIEKEKAASSAKQEKETRRRAEYSQYVSNLRAASAFLDEGEILLARKVLRTAPAVHRDVEWAILAFQAWPPIQSDIEIVAKENLQSYWSKGGPLKINPIFPTQTSGGIYGGVFSHDGEEIYIFLGNGDVKKFGIISGKLLSTYTGVTGSARSVTLSPDSQLLASFSFSNRATIWNEQTSRRIVERTESTEGEASSWYACWSADNKFLFTTDMDGSLGIWDAKSLRLLRRCKGHQTDAVFAQILGVSSEILTASQDGNILRWTYPEGEIQESYSLPAEAMPSDSKVKIEYQTISPSGKYAAVVFRDGSRAIWEIAAEKIVSRIPPHPFEIYRGPMRVACAFANDDSVVTMIEGSKHVGVYDVTSGKRLARIELDLVTIDCIKFSPNARRILATSQEGAAQVLQTRQTTNPRLEKAHKDIVFQMDFNDAGDRLLLGSFDSSASIWNAESEKRERVYHGDPDDNVAELVAVDLNRDGTRAATLDAKGSVHVWDTSLGEKVFAINPQSQKFARKIGRSGGGLRGRVLNFSTALSTGLYSPDGTKLVVFQKDSMQVFDARTGDQIRELEGANDVGWAIFNHDSTLVAILPNNKRTIGVWRLDNGRRIATVENQKEHLVMASFSPVDDTLVSCGMDTEIILSDARTGREIRRLTDKSNTKRSRIKASGVTTCCKFSDDGKYILTGFDDGTARIWESNTGRLVTTLIGHRIGVSDVRFSPDKRRILTCGTDSRAIIWDRHEPFANQLAVITGDSKLIRAVWSPNQPAVFTAWTSGSVRVFSGATHEEIEELKAAPENFESDFQRWQQNVLNARRGGLD